LYILIGAFRRRIASSRLMTPTTMLSKVSTGWSKDMRTDDWPARL
jgi:hypothetical protein